MFQAKLLINFFLCLASITCLFSSCSKTDFTKPEMVLKSFKEMDYKNKGYDILYDKYLSSKSKEYATKDEFIKTKQEPDSIAIKRKVSDMKITPYSVDANNPSYRKFKIDTKYVFNGDTSKPYLDRKYYTLINENGNWKIIWLETLRSFAAQKFYDGNYSEARKTNEKLIELNPFDADAYSALSWCYLRDKSLQNRERENGVVKNAKYALGLEEDNAGLYNTMSTCYGFLGNTEMSIQALEKGLTFCLNNVDKITFYQNLAGSYLNLRKFDKAEEYLNRSLAISPEDPFSYLKFGQLMEMQEKIPEALEYYEKALTKSKMENSLQGALYSRYAYCCFKQKKCAAANEYISKALDIDPNNDQYQAIYSMRKRCE